MSEEKLWSAYCVATRAYVADKSPAVVAQMLAAYRAWVRSYCPESADQLIAEQRARLEVVCAA